MVIAGHCDMSHVPGLTSSTSSSILWNAWGFWTPNFIGCCSDGCLSARKNGQMCGLFNTQFHRFFLCVQHITVKHGTTVTIFLHGRQNSNIDRDESFRRNKKKTLPGHVMPKPGARHGKKPGWWFEPL